jgi:hypothetical protein
MGDLEGRVLGEQGLQGACDGLLLVGVHLDGLHWHLGSLQGLQHGLLLAGNQQQQSSPLCKQRTPQHLQSWLAQCSSWHALEWTL